MARFDSLLLRTPPQHRQSLRELIEQPKVLNQRLQLTPVLEEFSNLQLTTPPRQTRDDFGVTPLRPPRLELTIAEWEGNEVGAALENLLGAGVERSENFNAQIFEGPPSEHV